MESILLRWNNCEAISFLWKLFQFAGIIIVYYGDCTIIAIAIVSSNVIYHLIDFLNVDKDF